MAGEEWTYERAGVSIDRGDQAVRRIRQLVGQTRRPEVVEDVGGFAGVFRLPGTDLVAGADGVGSKILIAEALGEYRTIGIDLVAMNVNDILAAGAEPLFFLDYIATGHVDPDVIGDLVAGMVEGCRQAGCALLGGETAEMPDLYGTHHDLAGFAVGRRVHSPRRAPAVGDKIFGVASSGFHSNGYQLIRKLVESQALSYDDAWPGPDAARLGDQLLTPTCIYVPWVLPLLAGDSPILAMAHITGGGLVENLPRTLGGLGAVLDPTAWPVPDLMREVARWGNLSFAETARTFNLGIGFTVVVSKEDVSTLQEAWPDTAPPLYLIGEVHNEPGVGWR